MIAESKQSLAEKRIDFLQAKLQNYSSFVRPPELPIEGRLIQMTGLTLVASGCQASIGSRCKIISAGNNELEAEVVGFSDSNLFLMPIGRIHGLNPGAKVIPIQHYPEVGVGDELLGRVIDCHGNQLRPVPLSFLHHRWLVLEGCLLDITQQVLPLL